MKIITGVCVWGLLVAGSAMAAETSNAAGLATMQNGMPLLAKEHKCVLCHSINNRIVGPAWMDVSKRYKGATTYTYNNITYPLKQGLLMKVSKGGPGNWGTMPMIGNDLGGTQQEELKKLVDFVLGLAV